MIIRSRFIIRCFLVISVILLIITAKSYADCSHSWVEIDYKESTCKSKGYVVYKCSICNEKTTKTLPLKLHAWSAHEIIKKATVFRKGKKVSYCYYCRKPKYKKIAKLKPFVKLSKKSFSLKKGKSRRLTVKHARGDTVKSFKSSNKKVARVSKKGRIKAKKRGKAIITVTLKSGKKAKCKVTVKGTKKKRYYKKGHKKTSRKSGKVYWTPRGRVYHIRRSCPTLSRSRVVLSGTIKQSHKPRCCKVCG